MAALAMGSWMAAASSLLEAGPRPLRHFYAVDGASLASLKANAAAFDLASPPWLTVTEAGALEDRTDPEIVAWARSVRLDLMPLVVNAGFRAESAAAVLRDPARASSVMDALVRIGRGQRFRGYQLDFEGLDPVDRDAYTAFARRFRVLLGREGLHLSIAVPAPLAARPEPGPQGALRWPATERSRAFDYAALAREARFVTLMTYDQHTAPDDPGPVAGMPWVEACLLRVLEAVPRGKLMLGVPLYYRRWGPGGVAEGAHGEAVALAAGSGVTPRLDATQRERTFAIAEGTGAPGTVWFQDAGTVAERLALVARHRLHGFSAWRLGHEDPELWKDRTFAQRRRSSKTRLPGP